MRQITNLRASVKARILASVALIAATACGEPPRATPPAGAPAAVVSPAPTASPAALPSSTTHDLSVDESMGGHTLARHVGRTDVELTARLRDERDISSASTYPDRAIAERVVGAAIEAGGRKLDAWRGRRGSRPNLVLTYTARSGPPIGRSMARGAHASVPCRRALVVLRWDERRHREFVLTSYPEADR